MRRKSEGDEWGMLAWLLEGHGRESEATCNSGRLIGGARRRVEVLAWHPGGRCMGAVLHILSIALSLGL
jgi:mannose/fructose-specific phosphotransferase system component IIA